MTLYGVFFRQKAQKLEFAKSNETLVNRGNSETQGQQNSKADTGGEKA